MSQNEQLSGTEAEAQSGLFLPKTSPSSCGSTVSGLKYGLCFVSALAEVFYG